MDDDFDWFEKALVEQLGARRVELATLEPIIRAFEGYANAVKWDGYPENRDEEADYKLKEPCPEAIYGQPQNYGWLKWCPELQTWKRGTRVLTIEGVRKTYESCERLEEL